MVQNYQSDIKQQMKTSISTIIVDSEIGDMKKLSGDLMAYPEIKIVATLTSPEKARKVILKQQPDLLFLGIKKPEMNGLELCREVRAFTHSNMSVVFYSAFDNYMIDALRASAFDYLPKSYHVDDLKKIVHRMTDKVRFNNANFEQSIRRLLSENQKFALHTLTNLLFLYQAEILFFQYFNESRYWQMTLVSMNTYKLRLSTTAKDILNIGPGFIQVSQNCIVNIDHLSSIENKTLCCVFYPPFENLCIYASRRYYSKIKEVLEIF